MQTMIPSSSTVLLLLVPPEKKPTEGNVRLRDEENCTDDIRLLKPDLLGFFIM